MALLSRSALGLTRDRPATWRGGLTATQSSQAAVLALCVCRVRGGRALGDPRAGGRHSGLGELASGDAPPQARSLALLPHLLPAPRSGQTLGLLASTWGLPRCLLGTYTLLPAGCSGFGPDKCPRRHPPSPALARRVPAGPLHRLCLPSLAGPAQPSRPQGAASSP